MTIRPGRRLAALFLFAVWAAVVSVASALAESPSPTPSPIEIPTPTVSPTTTPGLKLPVVSPPPDCVSIGREPTTIETDTLTGLLSSGGTDEQVLAEIFRSPDYYANNGGNEVDFVVGLYHDLLGREPSAAALSTTIGQIAGGGIQARNTAASEILVGDEYHARLIQYWYTTYLGRRVVADEVSAFQQVLRTGADDEHVQAAILGSDEYFIRSGSNNDAFINAVYNTLLGRAVNSSALAQFESLLTAGSGTRSQVAYAVLESTEYRQNTLIVQDFRHYMHHDPCRPPITVNCTVSVRYPSSAESLRLFNALGGGMTDEQLLGALAGSSDYYKGAGGTGEAFVNHLYSDLLGRQADPGGRAVLTHALSLHVTRQQAAMVVLSSAEYRVRLVSDLYHRFLGRNAEPLAVSQWVEVMGSGVTDEQVMSAVIGSPEYFDNAGGTEDLFLDRLYQDLLSRPIDEVGRASLIGALSSQDGRAQAAVTVLRSDEYRSDLVRADYLRFVKTRTCRVLRGDSGTSGLIAIIPGGWVTLIVGLALMGSAGLIARRVLRPRAGDDDVEVDV